MLDVEASRIKGSDTIGAPADYYALVIPNRNRTNLSSYASFPLVFFFLFKQSSALKRSSHSCDRYFSRTFPSVVRESLSPRL